MYWIDNFVSEGRSDWYILQKCFNQTSDSAYILMGVDDDGSILGVNRNAAESMKRNFASTLNNPERMATTM